MLEIQAEIVDIKKNLIEINSKISMSEITNANENERPANFPMTKETELRTFDTTLKDPEEFQQYISIFNHKIQVNRSATTMYNRRRSLKELMFSE